SAGDDDAAAPLVDNDADGPRRFVGHRRRRQTVLYKVGPGDTVLGVAKQFGIDADDLAHQIHVDESDNLKAGTLIKLEVRRDVIADLSAGDKDPQKGKDEKGKAKDGKEGRPRHGKGHREAT